MSAYLALTVENESPTAPGPAVQLWQMVVYAGVVDSLMDRPSRERDAARRWLFDSPDFCRVCDLADWNPDYIRQKTRALIESGQLLKRAPQLPRRGENPEGLEQ